MSPTILIILLFPFIILVILWIYYFKKIINEGLKFVGESYQETRIYLRPKGKAKLRISGRCVIVVEGANNWITLKYNNIYIKIFKIRLLTFNNTQIEIINDSRFFSVNVILRANERLEVIQIS
ncbi:MAG: hypothetical protein QXV69_04075 [Sulfolobaceae archaeon]